MIAAIPTDLAVGAGYRIAVLVIVLIVGWPVRKGYHWPIGIACLTGIGSNIAFLYGDLRASAVLAVPYIGLVGWVFIRKMQDDPVLMRHLLARKEAEWSKERHDLIGEQATLQARLDYCERQLAELHPPDPA